MTNLFKNYSDNDIHFDSAVHTDIKDAHMHIYKVWSKNIFTAFTPLVDGCLLSHQFSIVNLNNWFMYALVTFILEEVKSTYAPFLLHERTGIRCLLSKGYLGAVPSSIARLCGWHNLKVISHMSVELYNLMSTKGNQHNLLMAWS